jgi:LacI family transcriptional regulator
MTVRLKDVAQDLGLSAVTVSKVLRDHPDISEETRKRVLKRLKEMNYQPNLAARSLITGRTWTLGVLVPDLLHPFFASIAQSVAQAIQPNGYSLLIMSSDEDAELEKRGIHDLLARRVECIMIASAQWSVESFRRIEEQKTPYILLDRQFAGLDANFVGVDDQAVGMLATRHLIEQGCRNIAHIRGPEVSTAQGRLDGYRKALYEAEMQSLPGHVVSLGSSGDHRGEPGGYEAARQLLQSRTRPDGIFCFNDPSALGAMRAILDAGLRIPEDIAVVGCGNLSYSDFLRVPLTSVDQGSEEIGRQAAQLAMELIAQKIHPAPIRKLTHPRLVVRASSSRVSAVGNS